MTTLNLTALEAVEVVKTALIEAGCSVQVEPNTKKILEASKEVSAVNPWSGKEVKGVGRIEVDFMFGSKPKVGTVGSESRGEKLIELYKTLNLDIQITDYEKKGKALPYFGAADEESF